ncbi:MAG: hypothetical protein FJ009_14225 [Chloroflexi bacterium]|nr:hypothetical protein [Chloroflexota bacterium]
MLLIDRAVAIIKPKQPFLDWINRTPDPPAELTLEELRTDCTVLLIPEYDDPAELQSFLTGIYEEIFAMELDSWDRDEAHWPSHQDYATFLDWFDVEIHSEVIDALDREINAEAY